ncbi:uncharacterized protein N7515_006995 [Penicillium bovifimosum]|uniref:Uncharacterized protein n=1 Tax=Penicillium bovifimosum TaxID=126998 RepID=A0A9W9L198_9EURO|nr:uncharacterized protein N7515_006995 [Penicillium bovifimosum]KAJ5130956.1 hypothetical protein N7515_006995 [Penicillium bovifimosum]
MGIMKETVGVGVGDILSCFKLIAELLEVCYGSCTEAPKALRDLDIVLRGLKSALTNLQGVLKDAVNEGPRSEADKTLSFTISSCMNTLKELEKDTRDYRPAAQWPPFEPGPHAFRKTLKKMIKTSWNRFVFQLRINGSLSRHEGRLRSYVNVITLEVETRNLAATDRLEKGQKTQSLRMEEIQNGIARLEEGQAPALNMAEMRNSLTACLKESHATQTLNMAEMRNDIVDRLSGSHDFRDLGMDEMQTNTTDNLEECYTTEMSKLDIQSTITDLKIKSPVCRDIFRRVISLGYTVDGVQHLQCDNVYEVAFGVLVFFSAVFATFGGRIVGYVG